MSSEKTGPDIGEESSPPVMYWWSEIVEEESEDETTLEPGLFCCLILSMWASTTLKLILSIPCFVL